MREILALATTSPSVRKQHHRTINATKHSSMWSLCYRKRLFCRKLHGQPRSRNTKEILKTRHKVNLCIHWICEQTRKEEKWKRRKRATNKKSSVWRRATESTSKQAKHKWRTTRETVRHSRKKENCNDEQRKKQNDRARKKKSLFKRRHIINSFRANTRREGRVFRRFNRLYAPCGSGDSTYLYLVVTPLTANSPAGAHEK